MLKCVLFEDADLLAINKPAGLNTHAPSPYAGEGIYDWLRHREPRWAKLAIIHRLDKETSGIIVFSKSAQANRSLTEQFTNRSIRKKYFLLTDRPVPQPELTTKSYIARAGEKYVSRPQHSGGELAETRFRVLGPNDQTKSLGTSGFWNSESTIVEAQPITGRTHQIRVQAAEQGFPILGDTLYGGTPALRVYLHASEITFKHPATGQDVTFCAPLESGDSGSDPFLALRAALIEPEFTNAYRMIHGASDGWPGWYVDRFGEYLLSQSQEPLGKGCIEELQRLVRVHESHGACHKLLRRDPRAALADVSPQPVIGSAPQPRFVIRENGLQFELSFGEGYSVGLFLDQRDNRRRLLTGRIAAGFPLCQVGSATEKSRPELLNTFAYTCAFSVCAAKAGFRTTSLDLSRKYLEWGRRNFALNDIDIAEHDFIYGDAFDWLRRLAKKQRLFDVILLDPPTFSQSKAHGVFRVEKDLGKLVSGALPLLKKGGVLFASTNAADWPPEKFLAAVTDSVGLGKRRIVEKHYVPQPPDFPISKAEPAHLKSVWLQLD
jgi:23S rRNA (cytosine1962-C5)-methyltransferase